MSAVSVPDEIIKCEMYKYPYMGKYINVGLPEEMIIEIGRTIQKSNLGYKSKSEFVKEAIRISLKELAKYDDTKKIETKKKK